METISYHIANIFILFLVLHHCLWSVNWLYHVSGGSCSFWNLSSMGSCHNHTALCQMQHQLYLHTWTVKTGKRTVDMWVWFVFQQMQATVLIFWISH